MKGWCIRIRPELLVFIMPLEALSQDFRSQLSCEIAVCKRLIWLQCLDELKEKFDAC